MRLFLDANVLFTAAHNPKGKAAFLLELAGEGHWICLTSRLAIEEARRNLERKFPDRLDAFYTLLTFVTIVADRAAEDCTLQLAEKDRPIFAAALAADASHLLTGDLQHFGAWMNRPADTAGIVVQTLSAFLSDIAR